MHNEWASWAAKCSKVFGRVYANGRQPSNAAHEPRVVRPRLAGIYPAAGDALARSGLSIADAHAPVPAARHALRRPRVRPTT